MPVWVSVRGNMSPLHQHTFTLSTNNKRNSQDRFAFEGGDWAYLREGGEQASLLDVRSGLQGSSRI